ncbi:V-type ATPase subunit [Methanospirillum sp. J.3.6.1-F.2.7.3]|jgi:V/A-type H+-transporting ATPase subunit C|uniref:V-type ATPase subunit n=1 Tax=Methanospirillum purgamenti TaxID=2834276 RepID=A0A8E7B3Y8_9EURY|nr:MULTISPECIES: V-type ATPase subunit [Methanospirillum]MDX8550803.1 V-type ATPase subunit [Methanospirillum hungatei]QVV89961.1 V-type ATPase subunit [Methanospirillum sp. J.3.6.1-F.2.7.3]
MEISDLTVLLSAGSPFITELTAAILIAIMFLLFLTLLSIVGYFPVLLSLTSYTPVVARIKARGVPYIEPELVQDLMQSGSLPDSISRLKSSGYLASVSLDCNPDQAEEELLIAWYDEVQTLRSQAPRDAWLFFDAILSFQEIAKVKRILRMVHDGRAAIIPEIPLLWPEEFTTDVALKIANSRSVSEAARIFHETRYGQILADGLVLYEKEKSVFYLDHVLDCMGFAEIKSQSSMVQAYLASPYRDYISILIDIQNIRTLIRAKHGGWNPQQVMPCLIDGGLDLPSWRLIQMNEMMSLPDLVRQLSGTRYDSVLSPLLRSYPSTESMLSIDLALDRYLLETISRLSMEYYHTGGPLLWYLVAKEFELRNIRIILTGLSEGLSSDQIGKMLITGPEET